MMRASTLGKTILIWEKLTDAQVKELQAALSEILKNYKELNTNMALPLTLKEKFQYLVVMQKENNVIVSSSKIGQDPNSKFVYSPILNGDVLYNSIEQLKCAKREMLKRCNVCNKLPHHKWINLEFNKSIESYLLSPNMNPVDFIQALQSGNPPVMYKKFLENVGFALNQNSVEKATNNSLYCERDEQEPKEEY